MKNGLLIWNVVLSLVAGLLLFLQFGTKKGSSKKDSIKSATDTTAARQFRIAYFEMDSVENNFNVVKDVKSEISAKETEYNNALSRIDETYRNKFNELNAKAETMTPDERTAAQNTLQQLGESLKAQKQDLDQKIQDFIMRKNLDVKKKLIDYLKEFNKSHNFSYIAAYGEADGIFYYKDTVYNVTAELIKGLNEYYKQVKK